MAVILHVSSVLCLGGKVDLEDYTKFKLKRKEELVPLLKDKDVFLRCLQ
jgi:hypothetical protein